MEWLCRCFFHKLILKVGVWGGVVVKTLRYWSDGPGIDSRWSLGIISVVPPTEPCALRSTQPLKVSTRDKVGRCVWLTTYHPCSAETSRKSGALTYPERLGPPWPDAGDLYFTTKYIRKYHSHYRPRHKLCPEFSVTIWPHLLFWGHILSTFKSY